MKNITLILLLITYKPFFVFSQNEKTGCVEGNCKNKEGKFIYDSGDYYIGQWFNKLRQGEGSLFSKNGDIIYKGSWLNDLKNGYGEMHYSNGDIYIGYWNNNERSGNGEMSFANGNNYKGTWLSDKMNGQGKLLFKSGAQYAGTFKENEFEGQGNYFFTKGSDFIMYSGSFSKGKYHGEGELKFVNGDIFEGNWNMGIRDGYGEYKWVSAKTIQKGIWKNDACIDCIYTNLEGVEIKLKVIKEKEINTDKYKVVDMTFKDEEYPFRIGEFESVVLIGNNILSYGYCNTSPKNQTKTGEFTFITDLSTLESISGVKNSDDRSSLYGTDVGERRLYINNNIPENNNSIFTAYSFTNDKYSGVSLAKNSLSNGKVSSTFKLFNHSFELSNNSNIETFEMNKYTIGSGLIAFSAKSVYSKKINLFVGQFDIEELIMVDLSSLNKCFKNDFDRGGRDNGEFSGYFDGKEYFSDWSPLFVFKENDLITVFVGTRAKGESTTSLIPVQINTKTNEKKVIPKALTYGDYNEYKEVNNNLWFLPVTGGFVNNIKTELFIYDRNLNLMGQMRLTDFTHINHITEKGDFIIVGGYTKTKGYLGYPNPIIQVIDKRNNKIIYSKVIASKNGSVDFINVYDDKIIIAIAGYFGTEEENTSSINSKFIIDEIDSTGNFLNDLFQK